MKLKILSGYAAALVMGVLCALPAFAQNVNPRAEAQLQNWMARDPRLRADPGLMDNPTYLRNHPEFAMWLQRHPNAHRQVEAMGAYDTNHVWRETGWWRQNNPNWIYQNHPEWIQNHPEWRRDGDWDEHHEWHDRAWWSANHGDWVAQHHPEWAAHREAAIEHHEAGIERHEEHIEHHEAAIEHHEERMEHHENEHGHDHDHH